MVATVAPVLPIVLELAVDLVLVVILIGGLALLAIYRRAFMPPLFLFASLFDVIRIGGFGHYKRPLGAVGDFIREQTVNVENGIAAIVHGTERGVAFLGEQIAQQIRWMGSLIGDLAETIEHRFGRLIYLFPPAALMWAAVHGVRALPDLWRLAHTAAHKAGAAYTATVDAGSWVRGRFVRTERELVNIAKRVKAHSRMLAGAGAVAVVGTALAKMGAGWVRCPRVTKAGRRLCGMDSDLLDMLLVGTVVYGASLDLVAFAHELQDVTDEVGLGIAKFARVKLAENRGEPA